MMNDDQAKCTNVALTIIVKRVSDALLNNKLPAQTSGMEAHRIMQGQVALHRLRTAFKRNQINVDTVLGDWLELVRGGHVAELRLLEQPNTRRVEPTIYVCLTEALLENPRYALLTQKMREYMVEYESRNAPEKYGLKRDSADIRELSERVKTLEAKIAQLYHCLTANGITRGLDE
jgi:hypothetical protein